jgi:hypothetical protein
MSEVTMDAIKKLFVAERVHTRAMVQEMLDKAVDRLDTRIDKMEAKFDRKFEVMDYRMDRLEGIVIDVQHTLEQYARAAHEDSLAIHKRLTRLEQEVWPAG